MPVLILLRHAKAVRDHEAPTDKARSLTPRGHADAEAAGREIAALAFAPRAALVSTAARTRETFAAAKAQWPALGPAMATTFLDSLYLAEEAQIWTIAAPALHEDGPLLIVGHNPGLHSLVAHLLVLSHDNSRMARAFSEDFPTAAFAVFDVEAGPLDASAPRLLAAWRPRG